MRDEQQKPNDNKQLNRKIFLIEELFQKIQIEFSNTVTNISSKRDKKDILEVIVSFLISFFFLGFVFIMKDRF